MGGERRIIDEAGISVDAARPDALVGPRVIPSPEFELAQSWESAFSLLGVTRGRGLWLSAGVPSSMVKRPEPLTEAARHFVIEYRKVPPGSPFDDGEYVALLAGLLDGELARLAEAYGREDVGLLRTWVVLFFFVCVGWIVLWNWGTLFERMLRSLASDRAATTQVRGGEGVFAARLLGIIRQHFDPDEARTQRNLVRMLRATALEPVELELLQLEVVDPEDAPRRDELTELAQTATAERSRRTWRDIHEALSESEVDAVLKLGREIAARLQMPPELVRLPPPT